MEQTLIDGLRPSIEEYLAAVPSEEQPALLGELVREEHAFRWNAGELPTLAEYKTRFAAHPETIERAFYTQPEEGGVPYALVKKLGEGGFGTVFLAQDTALNVRRALKVLHGPKASDVHVQSRFDHEIRLAANFDHAHIVKIFHTDTFGDGRRFVVMAYIDGGTLKDRLEQGPIQAVEAVKLLIPIVEAVEWAQNHGLAAHRDLKPANILMAASGKPYVADFGLAVTADEEHFCRQELSGTPAYMAPEQIRNGRDGRNEELHRCDLWALGVILYEMLTGRRPFGGNTNDEVFQRIESETPFPPNKLNNDVDKILEGICLKCLEKDAAARYQAMSDFKDALEWWRRGKEDPGLVHLRVDELQAWAWQVSTYSSPEHRPTALEDAERHLQDGLDIVTKAFGPCDSKIAECLIGLGSVYMEQGDLDKAEKHLLQAKQILEGCSNWRAISICAAGLAEVYKQQGRNTEMEQVLGAAIGDLKKGLGSENEVMVGLLRSLGQLFADRKEMKKAEVYLRRAFDLCQIEALRDPETIARLHGALGVVYLDTNRREEAAASFQSALAIWNELGRPDHLYIAKTLFHLARLHLWQGKIEDASKVFTRVIEMTDRLGDSLFAAMSLCFKGLCALKTNDGPAAALVFRRAIQILELSPSGSNIREDIRTSCYQGLQQAQAAVSAYGANVQVGRNDPCPCGSGQKFENCCLGSTGRDI